MSKATRRTGFTGRIQRGPMAADIIGSNFTQVFNAAVRDRRLSRRARGLLVEILSHRDGFGISVDSLVAAGPEGRDAIRAALAELEKYGYLHREQDRDGGRFAEAIYRVTDMPDGLLIGAPAPWKTPEADPPENRRSEPAPENPTTVPPRQNRRSEPAPEKPTTAKPTTANPQHKKITPGGGSSPSGEEDLSLPAGSDAPPETAGRGGRENEAAPGTTTTDVTTVLNTYAEALGRPVLSGTRAGLERQAGELLAAGLPVEWLADRARELAAQGWTDLVQHVERSTVPLPGARLPAARAGLPGWCGRCGDGNPAAASNPKFRTDTGLPSGRPCSECHPAVAEAAAVNTP